MRTRHLLTTALFGLMAALTVSASAQNVVSYAFGEGDLRNAEGQAARTKFSVRKLNDNLAEGALRFGTRIEGHGTVAIFTDKLPRLDVQLGEARFGGPSLLEFTNLVGETKRFEGRVHVNVADNKVLWINGQWRMVDLYEIRFEFAGSDRTFSYRGLGERTLLEVGKRLV